jgi:hypothetical protein
VFKSKHPWWKVYKYNFFPHFVSLYSFFFNLFSPDVDAPQIVASGSAEICHASISNLITELVPLSEAEPLVTGMPETYSPYIKIYNYFKYKIIKITHSCTAEFPRSITRCHVSFQWA